MSNMYKAVGYMASVAALGSMLAGPAMAGGLENRMDSVSVVATPNGTERAKIERNGIRYNFKLKLCNDGDTALNFDGVSRTYEQFKDPEDQKEIKDKAWINGKVRGASLEPGKCAEMNDRWFETTYSHQVMTEKWIGRNGDGEKEVTYSIRTSDFK